MTTKTMQGGSGAFALQPRALKKALMGWAMCAALLAHAGFARAGSGGIDLAGVSVEWDHPDLMLHMVGSTSFREPAANPLPVFNGADEAQVVLQFDWTKAQALTGFGTSELIPLPVFQFTAADGWAITSVGGYFNGSFQITGNATISAAANGKITFDLPSSPADRSSHSISPFGPDTSSQWQLSDWSERALQCAGDGICTGAKHAVLDLSQSFRADFGAGGGSAAFSFRPVYWGETYSFQFVSVNVVRVNEVPEPSSVVLMAFGLGSLGLLRRRRKASAMSLARLSVDRIPQ